MSTTCSLPNDTSVNGRQFHVGSQQDRARISCQDDTPTGLRACIPSRSQRDARKPCPSLSVVKKARCRALSRNNQSPIFKKTQKTVDNVAAADVEPARASSRRMDLDRLCRGLPKRHNYSQETGLFLPNEVSSCYKSALTLLICLVAARQALGKFVQRPTKAFAMKKSSSRSAPLPVQGGRSRAGSAFPCTPVAFFLFSWLVLHPVQAQQALPPSPSALSVKQVTDSSVTITWTSVPNAKAYRILNSPNAPGPYTTFKEYYAPRNFPAPNEVTLTDLIEGDMYFLKVLSGNAIGEFETVGSPIVVAIPTLSVRTAAKNLFVEAYDATFVRISWEVPGGDFTGSNGPAASHFAVAYRCDLQAGSIVYPQEYTSTTATVYASFTMGRSCQFFVISRNLNYNPSDPWSSTSGKNKWSDPAETILWNQPAAATNLRPTAATLTSITLSFNAVSNAIAYQTSYALIENGNVGAATIYSTGVSALETIITGLAPFQLYRFSVQAANTHAAGYGPAAFIDVRMENTPAEPILRIDTVQDTSLIVSWIAPVSTQPISYELKYEQGGVENGPYPKNENVATLSSLTQGVPVLVSVRAKNLIGYGNYATITATPLLRPTGSTESINLTLVEGSSERAVQLDFPPVAFSDRYKIQISQQGGAYIDRGDVFMQTSGSITGLLADTQYKFRVLAGNVAGFSFVGTVSQLITTAGVLQPVEKLSNFRVIEVTTSSVLLQWDTPPVSKKITYVRVEKDPTGFITNGGTISGLPPEAEIENRGLVDISWTPTYNVSRLILNQAYYFAITPRTANRTGYTGVSRSIIQVKPTTQPTAAVQNLRVIKIFPSSVVLSFSALSGQNVLRYRISGSTGSGNNSIPIPSSEVDHPLGDGVVEYAVTGLDTSSVYSFSVTARNYNVNGYTGVPAATINDVRLVGLPKPPINLRVTTITENSIALAWERSLIQPIASVFKVFRRLGTAAFDQNGVPELSGTEITLTGLERGVLYDFKVFAGTLAGYELQGSNLASAAPVSRPKEVDALIIVEIAPTSVSLRWEPATFPKASSFLLKYLDKSIETTQFSYTATGLTPGVPVTYSIFTRNINALGYETKGQTVVVTTIGPPGLVKTLRIVGVSPVSVTVEYDQIELVNVTKIKVQVKRATSENWTDYAEYQCRIDEQYLDRPPTCSTRIKIDNLILGVLYDARVLQRNSNSLGYQEGGKSLTISPTLKPTRSAQNLQVVGVTTSSVFLEFERPIGVDAPTHYKIVYRLASGGPEIVTEEFPTSQQTLNVTGLQKDVRYNFQLIGRNLNLDGYTNAVRSEVVSTAPFEKPSKVTNISNPGVGAQEITIAWDPPVRGPVSLYSIDIANATTMINGVRIDVAELGLAPAYRPVGSTTDTTFTFKATEEITIELDVKLILRVSAKNLNIEGYGQPAEILSIPTAEPKYPPQNFTVESVTPTSVYLSWMPPAGYVLGDGTVTRYVLEGCAENCGSSEPFPASPGPNEKWYVMGGAEYEWRGYQWKFTGNTFWRKVSILPYTQISYTVTKIGEYFLETDHNYEFRVSAANKNTLASGPVAVLFKVMPLYPPGSARKVVVSNPKITEFALNFVPPLVLNTSGPADRYKVMVHDLVSDRKYEHPTILFTTSLVISGFLPGTRYALTVYAGNLAGYDPIGSRSVSEITTRATPCTRTCCEEAKGCTKCCGLLASMIQNNQVQLKWNATPNLNLMHYKVEYQTISAAWVNAGIFWSNSALITGLDFSGVATYRFRITGGSRTQNTFDDEKQAGEIVVTSQQDVLLEDKFKLEVLSVTPKSVTLKWSRPYRPFSVYEVQYAVQVTLDAFDESGLNNTRWIESIPDPDQGLYTTFEVKNLDTDQYYTFRVVAKTPYDAVIKDGVYSNAIRTKPSFQPLPVQNLLVALTNLDLVAISWENPIDENIITDIKVSWIGKNNNGSEEFPGSRNNFNVSGLLLNEPYVFRVQAKNLNIDGYEAGVKVTGVPQATPSPPLNLRLIQYYTQGVELQWEHNPFFPRAVRYQIQCRCEQDPAADYKIKEFKYCVSGPAKDGAKFVKAIEVDGSSTFALVMGIGEEYTYQFRVCAVGLNFQGAIDSTCGDFVAVIPGPPPPPSTLTVDSVTTSSITLSWIPDPKIVESWSFIPGKDQPNYDISCLGGSVEEMKAACSANGGCVGFSTTGCLKSDLGLESSWISYSSTNFAKGQCCIGANQPTGYKCTASNLEMSPKPACGCQCKGLWRKNLQHLLQMSGQSESEPFANVQIGPIAGSFGTRISKPKSCDLCYNCSGCCDSCDQCPSSCAEVRGLVLNYKYSFRLYTRNLNGVGYAGQSSNLVTAIPQAPPVTAVTDLRVRYTSENRVQLAWTGITSEFVTQYRVLASLDGETWKPAPPMSVLDLVEHQSDNPPSCQPTQGSDSRCCRGSDGVFQCEGGAGLLNKGTKYWLKVQARNLNSLGYEGVNLPSSNVVTAVPYSAIGPVLDLNAIASETCTDIFCCECCKANLCRGMGSITLTWKAPPGPIETYRVEVAERSKTGTTGSFTLKNSLASTSTTTNVTGLLLGTDYVFKVLAVSKNAETPYLPDCIFSSPEPLCASGRICLGDGGNPKKCMPAMTYASPFPLPTTSVESTLKVVRVTNATITVQWQSITSDPVTRYQVSYSTNILKPDAQPFAEIDQLNGTMQTSIGAISGPPEMRLTTGLLQEQQSYFIYVIPRNLNNGGYAICPKTALSISSIDLGDGSYKLSWVAPTHTQPILSYRFWYHRNGTSEVLTFAGRYNLITSTSALEYTLRGLTAGGLYKFYVIPSASPCAMIGPVVATNQPNRVHNFIRSKSSESSIEFSWSPSQAYNGYSLSQAYVLSLATYEPNYPCQSHNFTVSARISATQDTYAFTGLKVMQSYCFRIFAENYHEQVSGPASYYQAQPMGLPYAPPLQVTLVARNNLPGVETGASISLKWVKPTIDRYVYPNAAEILHYKVAYWKQTDITCLQKFVHVNCIGYKEYPYTFPTTTGNVTGLHPATAYYFKVYSGNPSGYDYYGSEPLGPIYTTSLPGPVKPVNNPILRREEVGDGWYPWAVTASSVTLKWAMPTNPSPLKLKLAYREHATERQVTEERSCTDVDPCPSEKEWTGLTTTFNYTFTVHTGGPDDNLIPIRSMEAYSGVASLIAAPYQATSSPRNLTKISWSDTDVRIRFLEPSPDTLNGPVLDYFLEGMVNSEAWTYTSVGARLSPLTAGQELSIKSIGGRLLNFQEKYSFRVFTRNLCGNSTITRLENITLYPKPSLVPTLVRTSKTAQQTTPAFNLEWGTPLLGSSAGLGFKYVLEVSDDMGATFYADVASPFQLGSSQATINFVNRPRPVKVENGKSYVSRVRPNNDNTDANIASVPAKTLITYTALPPGPVRSIAVEFVTLTSAAVRWLAPYTSAQLSFAEDYDLYYDCHVAIYSMQPKFWPLNGTFANIRQTGLAFTLTEVKAALVRAGAPVSAADSRFFIRVIPKNSAGVASNKNPSTEIWFVRRPEGKLNQLSILSTRNGSVDIRWTFPNTSEGLVGFDIRTSSDGRRFLRNKIVPSTYLDAKGLVQVSTSTTIAGLPIGKNWIQILELSKSDLSIGFSMLGPALIDSSLETVSDLQALSVTANSAFLSWSLPDTSILGWEVSYKSGNGDLVGPLFVLSQKYNVTGLVTGVVYNFFVRTRSESGLGLPSTVSATTMNILSPVYNLQILPFDVLGNLRIAWHAIPSPYTANFRVRIANENRDGNIAVLRTVSNSSTSKMCTIPGLFAGQQYRFVVESANLHENGFGSPTVIKYTVPNKPVAPTQVLVAFSLNNGLILKWTTSTSGFAVTYFKIEAVNPSNIKTVLYYSSATRMSEVQGLDPCTLYTITVTSCNLAGCTAAAPLSAQRTAPSQPVGLKNEFITTTSVTLSWQHPAPTNLPYQYYYKYRLATTVPLDTSVLDGRLVLGRPELFTTTFEAWSIEFPSASSSSGTNCTISGLATNGKYQIAIFAEFASIRALPVFIMAMPANAPQSVESFYIADDAHNGVLDNGLTLRWTAPAASTLTHYDLFYWTISQVGVASTNRTYIKIGVFEANENPDGSGPNFYTINNLITFQRYGFQIITRNLNTGGTSNPMTMIDCTDSISVGCTLTKPIPVYQPGMVQNLRLTATTNNSVTLTWEAPPSTNDNLLLDMKYEVSYKIAGTNNYTVFNTFTSTNGLIPNLILVAPCNFRVRARNGNSAGYGPGKIITGMTNVVCASTGCKVRDLSVIAYSSSQQPGSVTISWSPPPEKDSNPYLDFYYEICGNTCSNPANSLGPETSQPLFTFIGINIGESKVFSVRARTLNKGQSSSNGFGSEMAITALPKLQPAALPETSRPVRTGVSPTSVTLAWTAPAGHSPPSEFSYMVGWRLAGTKDLFLNPTYSTTSSAVITGLTFTKQYEFKVFCRNLNSFGFEAFGSPTLITSSRATLGPPPDFTIAEVTGTSITLTWKAHPGVTGARYLLTFSTDSGHKNNITVENGIDVFSGTKTDLTLGNTYYFSLRVQDIGGWSELGYRKARTITKATAVRSLAAYAIDADDAGLSWEPPMDLGSPSQGLSIGGYTIDWRVYTSLAPNGFSWVNLGTSKTLRFNHKNITQRGVTYTYRVAALIQQADEFGYLLNPGPYSEQSLFFGTGPIFVGTTPPDNKTFIALQSATVYIPLQAFSQDVEPNQLTFRCTGALPSVATLSPAEPDVNVATRIASQNLAVTFVPDLAGSQFYLCMQARDINGLRSEARCYTILLPLSTPKWLAPASESAYEARVGCTLTVRIVVEDRTSSNIDPGFAAEGGFIPQIVLLRMTTESSYKSSVSNELPAGATLVTPATGVKNPSTTNLVWRLRKGQEGFAYRLCFSTASANDASNLLCMSVTTARCQYCTKSDDSLQRVAKEWHATWSQVWSGNHILNNPDLLFTEQIVQVGPMYTVQKEEDLNHIALRYGVDLNDLLFWNPDVADIAAQRQHYVIRELQELCVVPQSCVYESGISSSPSISHAAL